MISSLYLTDNITWVNKRMNEVNVLDLSSMVVIMCDGNGGDVSLSDVVVGGCSKEWVDGFNEDLRNIPVGRFEAEANMHRLMAAYDGSILEILISTEHPTLSLICGMANPDSPDWCSVMAGFDWIKLIHTKLGGDVVIPRTERVSDIITASSHGYETRVITSGDAKYDIVRATSIEDKIRQDRLISIN